MSFLSFKWNFISVRLAQTTGSLRMPLMAGRLGESQSGGPHLSSRTLTEKMSQFLRPSGLDWQGKLTVGTISTAVSVSHDDIHRIVFLKVML